MGVIIAATAAVDAGSNFLDDTAAAVTAALEQCDMTPDQVHALINTGIYRQSNIVEPAVSALISMKAGIGLEYRSGAIPTFSFDLMNGPCGVLNAIHAAMALLSTDSAGNVVICSGDEHPSGQRSRSGDFPYSEVAAAMVLTVDSSPAGFGELAVRSSSAVIPADGWVDMSTMGSDGRSTITVEQHTNFEDSLALAVAAAQHVLTESHLDPNRTLLVTGRPSPDFGAKLAAQLGIPGDAVAAPPGDRDPHTSGLTLAYSCAVDSGIADHIDDLLFVAGGGPTAAAITYRRATP